MVKAKRWHKSELVDHLISPHRQPDAPEAGISGHYLSVATPRHEMIDWSWDELENTHAKFHGLPFPERAHGPESEL